MVHSYEIGVICHPPYFDYLKDLIRDIRDQSDALTHIQLTDTDQSDFKKLREELESYKNIEWYSTSTALPIGEARTNLVKHCEATWLVQLDADVQLQNSYFDRLERILEDVCAESVGAIAGDIGIGENSRYGFWEGITDQRVYYSGLSGLKTNHVFSDDLDINSTEFPRQTKNMTYLQGFNHIVNCSILPSIGYYDDTYWSCEDRELACRIKSHGYDVEYRRGIRVEHKYNLSLLDVLRRKRIHGYWYGKLRSRYDDYIPAMDWDLLTSFAHTILFGKADFTKTLRSRIYVRLSSFSFLLGSALSIISDFRYKTGWKYERT